MRLGGAVVRTARRVTSGLCGINSLGPSSPGFRRAGDRGLERNPSIADGEFVGNGHSEGPLGVLGTWPVPETAADGPDFTGCSEQT